MNDTRKVKLSWQRGLGVHGNSCRIPNRPGIYAYGVIQAVGGLPVSVEWAYIGKAKNLRQRIKSHDPRYETNPGLLAWLRKPPANAELWIAEVPEEELTCIERDLISSVNPTFNVNHRTLVREKVVAA